MRYQPKPVSFRLVRQTESEAVFENPAHDFPQRVLYRKTEGGLLARIENIARTKAEDFPFRRTSCE